MNSQSTRSSRLWAFLCLSALIAYSSLLAASPLVKPSADPQTDKPPLILVMGDSLSAAYKLPESEGWVALLTQRLGELNLSHRVINASVSGATTSAGIQRLLPLLDQHKPDYVLLELGANDGLQGMPISGITRNLELMIEKSQDAGAKVVLMGIRLPPNLGRRYTEPFFKQYKTLQRKYDLAYVPFLLEGVAGVSDLMQSDGLHPNAMGQPIILENVWGVLSKVLTK